MPAIIWLPAALRDLDRLHKFVAGKNPAAAIRALKEIKAGTRLLLTSPGLGRLTQGNDGERELFISFGAAAYVIRYRLAVDGTPVIIRVWHSREDRFQP